MTDIGRIAVVLKGYPRLSETFIAQELLGLERLGLDLMLYSMRHPTDEHVHQVHKEIRAPVSYLPEYLTDEPMRVLKAWRKVRRLPGYKAAFRTFLSDLRRDLTRNRVRRWGQAMVLAAELPPDVRHLHAHFIHTPASVTFYASVMTGLAWTCSAHAKDIWTSTSEDLAGKLSSAQWVVTCTKAGFDRLKSLARPQAQVHLSYHGLDLSRFGPPESKVGTLGNDGKSEPVRLVTVCRAVEKKGLDLLIDALALLPEDLNWHWTHIGAGELVTRLKERAEERGVADRLTWRGPLPQSAVLEQYRSSDLFVLPCRIARDGDRDGLPNVIVEAQSQGLACVSTTVAGVPELVSDGINGLLVPPEDPEALAQALQNMITDPKRRAELGNRGQEIVRRDFDMCTSVGFLNDLFRATLRSGKAGGAS